MQNVFSNGIQRVRVWLVALARTKLAKENEPEENPQDFPSTHRRAINYTRCYLLYYFNGFLKIKSRTELSINAT